MDPAEEEELSCELRGMDHGLYYLVEPRGHGVFPVEVLHEEFRVAPYGGEYVVEVVGYPASEPPDRLHLLGLVELRPYKFPLLLRPPPLGNVPYRAGEVEGALDGETAQYELYREDLSVLLQPLELQYPALHLA